ncbi:MAG: hypothetical protein WCA46_15270 [Actinocatenispora sp.]
MAIYQQDSSPDEVESREELAARIADGGLAGLTVQGLRLDTGPAVDLSGVDVTDTLFVGCRFTGTEVAIDLVRRGAHVVPEFPEAPFPTQPSRLYQPDDLVAGFADDGFASMYDTRVYEHFLAHGGVHADVRTALVQRLHDAGIDDALADLLDDWAGQARPGPVVGVMGGHAEHRGSAGYLLAAQLGRALAAAGALVVTGGGPGVMEAANLGSYLAGRPESELTDAVDTLATAPDFTDHDRYTRVALQVRHRFPAEGRAGGLAVPTWLYGHEPANLFAGGIAKYFSNAVREDTILSLCRGGVVFAPGRAGTVQEVFQAATKLFYRVDGATGPLVFLDRTFWTDVLPVRQLLGPLLADTPAGDLTDTVHLIDDVAEAVAILTGPDQSL